jgi:hypothetical protein
MPGDAARGDFTEAVRRRPDAETIAVVRDKRDALPPRLAAMQSAPDR